MNKMDGTWRRCDHSSVSEALASVKLRSERPWEDQSDGDSVLTIVSIADPSNYNHPVHYPTDIQKKSRSKGNTKYIFYYPYISLLHLDRYEEERVKSSKVFVERVNRLSKEKPGGAVFHNLGVSLEDAGRHCPMCRLSGCCLGPNCLGYSGIFSHYITNRPSSTFLFTQSPRTYWWALVLLSPVATQRYPDFFSRNKSFKSELLQYD